jgi:hypothetical protein
MIKKLLPTVIIVSTLLNLSSCINDDDGNVTINIEEEFQVFLYEELQPGANKLNLHIQSIEALDCSNYDLGHSTALEDDNIVVSIDDFILEGDCDMVEALTHADAKFGVLADRSYDLEINLSLNSIINKGKLKVSSGTYRISMETSHGFINSTEILHSIPDGYCWGFFKMLDASATDAWDDFFAAMPSYTKAADLPDGHYGHFNISNNNPTITTLHPDPPMPTDAFPFLYQVDGDVSELVSFVKSFQSAQQGRVKVVLYTAEGLVIGL